MNLLSSIDSPRALPSVLVVHSDAYLRSNLEQALAGGFNVHAVPTIKELSPPENEPQVVMAEAPGARRLLKTLERIAPGAIPVFVCPDSSRAPPAELVDLASEGHLFHLLETVADPEEVQSFVRRVIARRTAVRMSPSGELSARLWIDGREYAFPCSDVSNTGISLTAAADAPVELFSPGQPVTRVELFRNGALMLRWDSAVIRHLHHSGAPDSSSASYRVGVQFIAERGTRSAHGDGAIIDDPARISAMIRRALRSTPKLSARHPSSRGLVGEIAAHFEPAADASDRPRITCTGQRAWNLVSGDVLEITFEISGRSYFGLSAVLQTYPSGFALSLPRQLTLRHRRSHLRFEPPPAHALALHFTSPLTSERSRRQVVDVDMRGLAFHFNAEREVFPSGLWLHDAELELPGGRFVACRARVRMTAPRMDHLGASWRCGVELAELSDAARKAILDAFVEHRAPGVRAAEGVRFREIWDLLNAAHLFHPDYPFTGGDHPSVLERTHNALASMPEGVSRTFGWYEDGKLAGHASGLRTHARTWMLQHLAVAPGFHRSSQLSRELSMLAVDFAEALDDVDWLRIFWRVENRWPDRIFGWIARSMAMPGHTALRFMQYARLPANVEFTAPESDLYVALADSRELVELERELRRRGELVRVMADDLRAGQVGLEAVGQRYRAGGLWRSRNVLVARDQQGATGYALVDGATRGVCWSELTNSFQLVLPERGDRDAFARTLTAAAVRHYRELGHAPVLALAPPEVTHSLVDGGFVDHGRVAEWTFHRSLARTWHTLMGTMFERLERRTTRETSLTQPSGNLAA